MSERPSGAGVGDDVRSLYEQSRSRPRPGPLMTTGLPLAVSLVLHALLLVGTALVVWRVTTEGPPPRPPVAITFSDPGQGTTDLTPNADPEDDILPTAEEAPEPVPVPSTPPTLDGESSAQDPPSAPALVGATSAAPGAVPTLRTGSPVEISGASSGSGRLVRAQPPAGLEVRFAGLGTSGATSVVYVVDGSGPMVSSLPIVLEEVLRSVSRLGPSQKFGVVIFRRQPGDRTGAGYEWFTPALIRATPDAVARLREWLRRIEPRGQSNPLDGVRAAITMEPEAIFLLSRSIERSGGGVWELGIDSTLEELDRLNPVHRRTGTRPIVIKTIQFLDEDPTGIMQAIGRLHGGATPENPNPADTYTVIRRAAELTDRGDADDKSREANPTPGAEPAAAPTPDP